MSAGRLDEMTYRLEDTDIFPDEIHDSSHVDREILPHEINASFSDLWK